MLLKLDRSWFMVTIEPRTLFIQLFKLFDPPWHRSSFMFEQQHLASISICYAIILAFLCVHWSFAAVNIYSLKFRFVRLSIWSFSGSSRSNFWRSVASAIHSVACCAFTLLVLLRDCPNLISSLFLLNVEPLKVHGWTLKSLSVSRFKHYGSIIDVLYGTAIPAF